MLIDRARFDLTRRIVAPDLFEELIARERFTVGLDQDLQKFKLLAAEVDRFFLSR